MRTGYTKNTLEIRWYTAGQDGYTEENYLRVPAHNMLHMYEPLRPGQMRGFPLLATALQTIQQLDDYNEATLERQKLAASFTLFIRRPAPLDPGIDPVTNLEINPDEVSESVITPGHAYTLLPGEEIEVPDMPTLGDSYVDFNRNHQRLVASATGVPYELLTGDWSNSNDRAARVMLGSFRRKLQARQKHLVVHSMCPAGVGPVRSHVHTSREVAS